VKTLPQFRVIFTFEARDEREAIQLVSSPDLMRSEAEMRIVCVSRRLDFLRALLLGPLVAALIILGYGLGEAWWSW